MLEERERWHWRTGVLERPDQVTERKHWLQREKQKGANGEREVRTAAGWYFKAAVVAVEKCRTHSISRCGLKGEELIKKMSGRSLDTKTTQGTEGSHGAQGWENSGKVLFGKIVCAQQDWTSHGTV